MRMTPFRVEGVGVEGMPEARTVHVGGRVTLAEAPEVRTALLREVGEHGGTKLVLELAGIDRIDTAGAAVLAEALRLGLNRGLRVLLCSPSAAVTNIFRLAGFADVLDHCCADSRETWQRLRA